VALAILRGLAERGADVGYAHGPAGPLRYAVRGPRGARQMLVLHGLADSIAGWARVLPFLARRHRVHIVDLPGHGLSGTPPDYRLSTLVAAVAHYAARLEAPLLVGHSLGGWLAARLASGAAARSAFSGLVLVNPGGAALPAGEWRSFRALLEQGDARAYLERAFHSPPLALRLFPGEVTRALGAPSARAFLAGLQAPDFLAPAELASLQLPVRLVWGESDRLLPAGTLPFFRSHLPRAEVTLLANAGHLPHFEAPRALARAIAAPFGAS
jgi:pimeloyl-ACP methyl ester carboxylesterase